MGCHKNIKEETIILKFREERIKFHFPKFQDKPNKGEQEEPQEGQGKSTLS
jgi:hypothetical protein